MFTKTNKEIDHNVHHHNAVKIANGKGNILNERFQKRST